MMKKIYRLLLKEKREAVNLKQKELAELSKVPISSISRYENNKRVPDIYTAYQLAQALGCHVDDLVNEMPDTEYEKKANNNEKHQKTTNKVEM